MNLVMQNEFVHEPYYIVDKELPDPEDPEDYETLVELSPRLKHSLRMGLGNAIMRFIRDSDMNTRSLYYTDEELQEMKDKEKDEPDDEDEY